MKNNCKHIICGTCKGYKFKVKSIGNDVSELCSPKCLAATKDICECKCEGFFHAGRNNQTLDKKLSPSKQSVKELLNEIEIETLQDQLAVFLLGTRIKTKSFDNNSDKNFRTDSKTIALNWLSPTGEPIDKVAGNFLRAYKLKIDENKIVDMITNFIVDYPSGIKKYLIERVNEQGVKKPKQEKINWNKFVYEDSIFGINNMKLKKGSQAAKDYMAKIRAKKNTNTTLTKTENDRLNFLQKREDNDILTPLQNKEYDKLVKKYRLTSAYKKNIPDRGYKKITLDFKPIKKIGKVVESKQTMKKSFTSKISGLFDTSIISDIDTLKKEYFKLAKKYHPDAGGTTAQFQTLQAEYEKHLKTLLSGSKLSKEEQANEIELDEKLRAAVDSIINLSGINIELAGKWIWVSGNTYPLRKELSSAGFLFAGKKKMWFYKGVESKGRGGMDMDDIRNRYKGGPIQPKPPGNLISGITISAVKRAKFAAAIKKAVKALNKRPN